MTEFADTDLAAIDAVNVSLARFGTRAGNAADFAMRAANDVRSTVASALNARQAELQRLTAELMACQRQPGANCGQLAQAVARAEERVRRATEAMRLTETSIAQFAPSQARFRRELDVLVGESRATLSQQSRILEQYLAGSGGGLGSGGGGFAAGGGGAGSGGTGSGATAGIPGAPSGFTMVPVGAVDTSDSGVHGPEAFGKGYSPDDLKWAFSALHEVVLPAMAAGMGSDYFHQRDAKEGLSGSRSYSDTYSGFFNDSAIHLDRTGNGYTVGNGYHRIWVAQQMGLTHVPARVS